MTTKQKILVKQAQMLALHNRYVKAMQAGEAYIQKLASAEAQKQAMYRKVLAGVKDLKKGK
jgi:hypothetical protein